MSDWVCKDGTRVLIADMGGRHLFNAVKHLQRKLEKLKQDPCFGCWELGLETQFEHSKQELDGLLIEMIMRLFKKEVEKEEKE